jgi:hypothetical protein
MVTVVEKETEKDHEEILDNLMKKRTRKQTSYHYGSQF